MLNKVLLVGELVAIEKTSAVIAVPPSPAYAGITVNLNAEEQQMNEIRQNVEIGSLATIEAFLMPGNDGNFALGIQNFYFSGKNKPQVKVESVKNYS